MTLIGGRRQNAGFATLSGPARDALDAFVRPATVVQPGASASDPVQAEIDRALNAYQERLAAETVVGNAPGVDVHMRLNGELVRIEVDEQVQLRYGAPRVGEMVLQAVQQAGFVAARRREELAEEVLVFEEPVLERNRRMIADPDAAREEMTAVRYW